MCRYTIGLLAESKIQTVYDRNTRRRTTKDYAGIAAERESRKSATDLTGIEHTPSHARGVRVSASPSELMEIAVNIWH